MRTPNPNNSTEKLVTLIGLASASVFISFPALALINSNHSSFDGSVNNRTHPIESSRTSRQLLAQSTSGTGGTGTGQSGTGTSGTGTGQTGTGTSGTGTGQTGTGTGGTGTGQPGTGNFGTGGTGTGQPGTGNFGTGGTGTGQPGTGNFGTGGTGTGQPGTGNFGTGGTGTGQPGTGNFGTGGTGTSQPGTGNFGTGGTGTGQPGTGGSNLGNERVNLQQGTFEELMIAGYTATNQRDYPTALAYFERALQVRPNNPYARRAVRNVRGYIQRDMQSGAVNRQTNLNR